MIAKKLWFLKVNFQKIRLTRSQIRDIINKKKGGETMSNQELCMLLDSLLALLETGNSEKAIIVIKNGIERIDKGATSSTRDNNEKE